MKKSKLLTIVGAIVAIISAIIIVVLTNTKESIIYNITFDTNGGTQVETQKVEKGNKVKVTLRFRGREMAHVQQSKHILDDFADLLKDVATVEKAAKMEGRNMSMVLTVKR